MTAAPLARRLRAPILTAAIVVGAFVGGIGVWSALAPLTTAAVAPGFVGIESRRKTVQHLEGGIIREILVEEGDRVKAGDILIRLDDTVARSAYSLLEGQYVDQYVLRLRLAAEQDGRDDLVLPENLPEGLSRERLQTSFALQRDVFLSRRKALENRRRIIAAKIVRLRQQIEAFEAEITELNIQRDLIALEENSVSTIVNQGLERTSRLYAVQRAASTIDGQLARLRGRIAEAEIAIGQADLEDIDLETNFVNQVTGELTNLANKMADMEPRLAAARNKLDRMEIPAPVSGTVLRLSHHTIGGVVRAGEPILDIVPEGSAFLIEAQVSLSEIDVVRPGLPAEVRLTAFSARTTPTIPGEVVYVSGDRLWDDALHTFYYAAHVKLTPETAKEPLPISLDELYPGMPVEVMVLTGRKTVLDYIIQPLTDAMNRALRE